MNIVAVESRKDGKKAAHDIAGREQAGNKINSLAQFLGVNSISQGHARAHPAAQETDLPIFRELFGFLSIHRAHMNLPMIVVPPLTRWPSVTSTRQPCGK